MLAFVTVITFFKILWEIGKALIELKSDMDMRQEMRHGFGVYPPTVRETLKTNPRSLVPWVSLYVALFTFFGWLLTVSHQP